MSIGYVSLLCGCLLKMTAFQCVHNYHIVRLCSHDVMLVHIKHESLKRDVRYLQNCSQTCLLMKNICGIITGD